MPRKILKMLLNFFSLMCLMYTSTTISCAYPKCTQLALHFNKSLRVCRQFYDNTSKWWTNLVNKMKEKEKKQKRSNSTSCNLESKRIGLISINIFRFNKYFTLILGLPTVCSLEICVCACARARSFM